MAAHARRHDHRSLPTRRSRADEPAQRRAWRGERWGQRVSGRCRARRTSECTRRLRASAHRASTARVLDRVAASCSATVLPRARGALRRAPADAHADACAPNTARGSTTQYIRVALSLKVRGKSKCYGIKPVYTLRFSHAIAAALSASISPPSPRSRGFPSNELSLKCSDFRCGEGTSGAIGRGEPRRSGSTPQVARRC